MTSIAKEQIQAKRASKLSKRMFLLSQYAANENLVSQLLPVEAACEGILKLATFEPGSVKVEQTIDVAIKLGIDPRKETVRGTVAAAHSLGKAVKVAVFCRGDNQTQAKEAGADIVGAEDLVEEVQKGNINFDKVVATPDMMMLLGKVAKILGPKGLMPNPKLGTVTTDVSTAVKNIKAGQISYKVEKSGLIHAAIGKSNFTTQKLQDNLNVLVEALKKARPSTAKGVYLKRAHLSSTMGLSVEIDCQTI